MVLTNKRLKEKECAHRTLVRVNWDDKVTIPMCVTLVVSPLGNSTIDWTIAAIEVKNFMEHTIWLVAPLSKTQTSGLIKSGKELIE